MYNIANASDEYAQHLADADGVPGVFDIYACAVSVFEDEHAKGMIRYADSGYEDYCAAAKVLECFDERPDDYIYDENDNSGLFRRAAILMVFGKRVEL